MIFTDAHGRPIPEPAREDFASDVEFVEARHEWARRIESVASAAVYHRRTLAERMAAQDRPTLRVLPWEDVEEVARPEETRS